jgi:hypothetical protein
MKTCFICGSPAETEEHIIPKWLQGRYNLWNQKISLPNRTTIQYKQLKIPCCNVCNNNLLSQLELKVQSGDATDEELWKWGAKIHFGLLRKDDFLEWDRKNPTYKIGEVMKRDDPLELERHLIHSIHGEFSTHPNPFGSVFRFTFDKKAEYHFAHLIGPDGLCISFGNTGYVIFIKDTGSLRRQPSIQKLYEMHVSNCHLGKMLNFFANSWVHLYRHTVNYSIMMTPKSIVVLGAGKLIEEKQFTRKNYKKLWAYITSNPNVVIVDQDEYKASNGIALIKKST